MNAVLHHNTPVMTAQGLFHDLDIYPDRLVVRRTDILSRLFAAEEVIFYDAIKALHAYDSRCLVNQCSQLIVVKNDGTSRTLTYSTTQRHLAQQVKTTIENFLGQRDVTPVMQPP